jgi:hypothetical protein
MLRAFGNRAKIVLRAFSLAVNERYNGALLTLNIFNTSIFPAYLLVFLLSV